MWFQKYLFSSLTRGQPKKCTRLKINQSLNCHWNHTFFLHIYCFSTSNIHFNHSIVHSPITVMGKTDLTWWNEFTTNHSRKKRSRTFSPTYPNCRMQLLLPNNFFPFLNMFLQRHYYCCWLIQPWPLADPSWSQLELPL